MADIALGTAVKAELVADPKVDANEVAVSVDGGDVTLKGTVGSLRQKIEAGRDAKRVRGVANVQNDLQVRILTKDRRSDAQLRGDVLQAMALDSQIPTTIDAKVDSGIVTLKGSATWNYQRNEAEFVASNVPGVQGVRSEIVLEQAQAGQDLVQGIQQGFARIAALSPDDLTVTSSDGGKVTLSGTVPSSTAHDLAVGATWMMPGVTEIVDNIQVQS
jgi:osmotically-inducible protein OsmY